MVQDESAAHDQRRGADVAALQNAVCQTLMTLRPRQCVIDEVYRTPRRIWPCRRTEAVEACLMVGNRSDDTETMDVLGVCGCAAMQRHVDESRDPLERSSDPAVPHQSAPALIVAALPCWSRTAPILPSATSAARRCAAALRRAA